MGAVEEQAYAFVCVYVSVHKCLCSDSECVCVHACIHLSLHPLRLTAPLPVTTYSIHPIIEIPTDPGGTPIEKPISFPFSDPNHLPISLPFSIYAQPARVYCGGMCKYRPPCYRLRMSRYCKHPTKGPAFHTAPPFP